LNIHEYQAKELLRKYGVRVPEGRVAHTVDNAATAAEELGGERWVVKAQIHAGGRGKGGGIRVAGSIDEVRHYADQLIGSHLVTPQTGAAGRLVQRVLVEQACRIHKEYYLGLGIDRGTQRITVIACAAGGMDIEEAAARHPEQVIKEAVDPAVGDGFPVPQDRREDRPHRPADSGGDETDAGHLPLLQGQRCAARRDQSAGGGGRGPADGAGRQDVL
jgi:succinyl-CoA synthetase beta subunit